jgi:plasmid stabilization system protein ParE
VTPTRFLEPAESELEEAIAYFNRQVEGLGDRFRREVEATVAVITKHPEIGSPITKRVRKFRVRKFKHKVIYIFDGEEIIIIAVAHHKKRPRYWRHRISPSV